MRTIPNDVNEKRKTIAAAAARAGASSGTVISRKRRRGVAPSVAAASVDPWVEVRPERPDDADDDRDVEEGMRDEDRRPSSLERLGQDCEERERDDDRRQHEGHDDERADDAAPSEAVPAEDVGGRERDRDRESVDASACQAVNQTTSRVVGSVRTSSAESPSPRRPRSTIAASG